MRAFRDLPDLREDRGVTLIELVVSLMIMSVMMTIFTTGILQMYQAANKTESLATAQSQLNTVFLRLDKVVRYAAWISDVQQDGEKYDVRMLTTGSGDQRCYGLKLNGTENRLLIAQWSLDDPPTVSVYDGTTIWATLATNVDAPTGLKPFERIPADAIQNFDRLQLDLVATTGSGVSGTKTNTNVRFTALNTSLARSSTDSCPLRQG
jgi:prepilin-type N-terminal cleavage/methylation domain-containing protein